MKTIYILVRILIFIIFFNFFLSFSCYSQEKSSNYFISLKVGPPIASSNSTFRRYWDPVIDLSLSALKRNFKNFYSGLGFDYSRFYIPKYIYLKSRLHIINPNIIIGYDINLLKRLKLFPNFSIGYSWMFFTSPITPAKYFQSYNESGISVKPELNLGYLFKDKISLGIAWSYQNIFKKFGSESTFLDKNTKEANNTSYVNLDFCLGFNF
jgi:hypothetical protein